MVDINVKQNQGIISAIQAKLQDEGVQVKDASWNLWEKVMEQVKAQNKENGQKQIYSGGEDIKGNGRKNFVVQQGIISFSEKIWNNIKSLFTGRNTNIQEKPKAEETTKDDVLIQNKTNTMKAISTITQNIDKISSSLNIPENKLNETLSKLRQKQPDIPEGKVSVGDMTASLLVDLLKEIMPNANDNDINFKAIKIAAELLPDDTIAGHKCSELSNNEDLIRSMNKNAVEEMKIQDVVTNAFQKAQQKLLAKLDDSNLTFPHPITGEKMKASELKQYIQNLTFKESHFGTAQAKTNEGVIEINTTPSDGMRTLSPLEWNQSETDTMKVLLHEALHHIYHQTGANRGFNTRKEELFVEKNAILLASRITDNPHDVLYSYRQTIQNLGNDPQLLDNTLQEWIDLGYKYRPIDETGHIKLPISDNQEVDIPGGSQVFIDENHIGNIGNGVLFDMPNPNGDIHAMFKDNRGKIVYTQEPNSKPISVKDNNGKIIFEAYFVENKNN